MRRIHYQLLACFFLASQIIIRGQENAPFRPVTASEVKNLFDLAVARPERSRIVADIKFNTPSWTKDQINVALKRQNEFMAGREQGLEPNQKIQLEIARSNAIVRATSSERILHVEEWFSGHYYRLDQTDEATVMVKYLQAKSNSFHDTFVNIHDPMFSPFASWSANNELHDALLSKDSQKYYQEYNLWQALGMDQVARLPLLLALADVSSLNSKRYPSATHRDTYLNGLKMDFTKAEHLRNGLDPNWHLEAIDEFFSGIRVIHFRLEGKKYPAPEKNFASSKPLSSIQVDYWIGKVSGRTTCLQSILTNLTQHTSFFSKREEFDADGLPRLWKTSTLTLGSSLGKVVVTFHEIDIHPVFTDSDVFAPKFATNYTVSDVTSGTGILLQSPHPEMPVAIAIVSTNEGKRIFVLIVLGLLSVIPCAIAIVHRYRMKR